MSTDYDKAVHNMMVDEKERLQRDLATARQRIAELEHDLLTVQSDETRTARAVLTEANKKLAELEAELRRVRETARSTTEGHASLFAERERLGARISELEAERDSARQEAGSLQGELKRTQELLARPSEEMADDEIAQALCALYVRALVKRGVAPWIDELGWAIVAGCKQHGIPVEELQRSINAKYVSLGKGRLSQ